MPTTSPAPLSPAAAAVARLLVPPPRVCGADDPADHAGGAAPRPTQPTPIPAPYDPDADQAEDDLVGCFVALRDAARSSFRFHRWLVSQGGDERDDGVICPTGIANDASGLPWVLSLVAGSIEVELTPKVSDAAVAEVNDLPPFDPAYGGTQQTALAGLLAELQRCSAICTEVADRYRGFEPEWNSGRAAGPWWAARHVAYLDGITWAISVATCVWDAECSEDDKDAAAARTAARHAPRDQDAA